MSRTPEQLARDQANQAAAMARDDREQAARNAAAVAEMRAREAEDSHALQDWLDGKDVPMPEGVRLRRDKAQGTATLKAVLRPFVPVERICPVCSVRYVGASRFCPPCSEQAIAEHDRNLAARMAQEAGTTVNEVRHKWTNLPPDTGRTFYLALRMETTGIPEAIAATLAWTAREGPPWLLLNGSIGIGKTHLAEVAARTLAAKGQRVRFQPVGELLDRLRMRGEDDSWAYLAEIAATPWLVLDDLGVSKPSDWVLDRLHGLINSRAVRRVRTLITTNDTLAGLTVRVGDRVADRVFATGDGLVTVATMTGPSFRTGR